MSVLKNYIRIITFGYLFIISKSQSFSDHYIYFMLLNVFLAYIPFEISNLAKYPKNKIIVLILCLFWLLFYPNAPYLLTDFFHLQTLNIYQIGDSFSSNLNDWISFSFITFGVLLGFILGVISLFNIVNKLIETFNIKRSSLVTGFIICLVSLASGFAIYFGRFPRLHTHYLLSDPFRIIGIMLENVNISSLYFALVMCAWQVPILILVYLMLRDAKKQ